MEIKYKKLLRFIVGLGIIVFLIYAFALIMLKILFVSIVSNRDQEEVEVNGHELYCNNVGSKVVMDRVFRSDVKVGSVPREFITKGGELYVVIKDISRTWVLDTGTLARIRIGKGGTDAWNVTNTLVHINAIEDEYDKFTIGPGQYWLWVSTGGNVEIISCEEDNLSLVEYEDSSDSVREDVESPSEGIPKNRESPSN